MKKIDFTQTMTEALQVDNLPKWQKKQRVPRDKEGRVVIHEETRDLFKEIARRNNTNMATVFWLAGHQFWHSLGYSRLEYDRIMVHTRVDRMTAEHKKEVDDLIKETGILVGEKPPTTDEERDALHKRIRERISQLSPSDQQKVNRAMVGMLVAGQPTTTPLGEDFHEKADAINRR